MSLITVFIAQCGKCEMSKYLGQEINIYKTNILYSDSLSNQLLDLKCTNYRNMHMSACGSSHICFFTISHNKVFLRYPLLMWS